LDDPVGDARDNHQPGVVGNRPIGRDTNSKRRPFALLSVSIILFLRISKNFSEKGIESTLSTERYEKKKCVDWTGVHERLRKRNTNSTLCVFFERNRKIKTIKKTRLTMEISNFEEQIF